MEAEVLGTDSVGNVKVAVNGYKLIFNSEVCTLLTRGSEDTDDDDNDTDKDDDDDGSDDKDGASRKLQLFLEHSLSSYHGMPV